MFSKASELQVKYTLKVIITKLCLYTSIRNWLWVCKFYMSKVSCPLGFTIPNVKKSCFAKIFRLGLTYIDPWTSPAWAAEPDRSRQASRCNICCQEYSKQWRDTQKFANMTQTFLLLSRIASSQIYNIFGSVWVDLYGSRTKKRP